MNVFPVSDSDTGSNLKLTLAGVARAVPHFTREALDDVVQAAILSAHGNSGAIVAEMFTSICRSLEHRGDRLRLVPPGGVIAALLRTVAAAATQAVARPVAGTILTVADEAARSAEEAAAAAPADALAVAVAAQNGARLALERTPEQLEVLRRAGVVDAGGQAYVLLLDVLVEVLGGPRAEPLAGLPVAAPVHRPVLRELEYEVMYALRGAGRAALDELRRLLSELGNSVVIVGDHAVAQVHVHLAQPGAAIEAALGRGRLSRIRVTALAGSAAVPAGSRTVISIVAGEGLAEAVTGLGGTPLLLARGPVTVDQLAQVLEQSSGEIVILPNDMENLEIARHLATEFRSRDRRIAVIPTVAQVQGLAAIAVHEPSAEFESAVVAMSSAAGHARHGAVTIAESPAMTMAGRCEVGDVLGVVDGDFVVIGDSVSAVALEVVERLLSAGGELLTLITGAGADPELAKTVETAVRRGHDGVDVETLDGHQQRYLLLVGVE
nr:DAK2 domain-containing protein [Microlunatus panaciterrae]